MTAKEYLKRYRRETERIRSLDESIARLEAEIGSITVSMNGMPRGSGTSDKTASLAIRLADKKIQREEMKAKAVLISEEIADSIHAVEDPDQAQLLYLRYIDGLPWDEIAKRMKFSEGHVRGWLHSEALRKIKISTQ